MNRKALSAEALRLRVRQRYGAAAAGSAGSHPKLPAEPCCGGESRCCGPPSTPGSSALGYGADELRVLPPGADLGLGCGNPTEVASLRRGEVVLDLGSGGGIDVFLAARKVGPRGRAIGVDMTPEMVARARRAAGAATNAEFRLGELEHLPVADASVDVVLSNCVVNLVPDKRPVYEEAFRVLRPGGRLAIADMVATRPIPARFRRDPDRWASCSSGALAPSAIRRLLRSAGFREISIGLPTGPDVPESLRAQDELGVVSATIRARKPSRARTTRTRK